MAEAIEQKKPKDVVFSGGGSFGAVFDGNVRQYGWLPAIFMQVFNWLFGKIEHLEQLTDAQNEQLKAQATQQLERSPGEYNRAVAQNLSPATNWSMANLHALSINSISRRAFETLYKRMEELHNDNKLGYVNQLMKMSEVDRKYVIPIIENDMLLSNITEEDKKAILDHLKDPKNNPIDSKQETILMSCRKSGAIVAFINIGEINHMVETGDKENKPFYRSNPDQPTKENENPTGSAVSKMQMRATTFADFMSRMISKDERGELATIGQNLLKNNNIKVDPDEILGVLREHIEKTTNSTMSQDDLEGYRRFIKNTLSVGSRKGLSKEQIVGGLFHFFGSEEGVNEVQLRLINEKSRVSSLESFENLSDKEAGERVLRNIFTNGNKLSSKYEGNDGTEIINVLMQYPKNNLGMKDVDSLTREEKIALIGKLVKDDEIFYQNTVVARHYFGADTDTATGFDHMKKHISRGFDHNSKHSKDIVLTDEEKEFIKQRYNVNGNLMKEGVASNIREYPFMNSTAVGGAKEIIANAIDKNIENNTKESIISVLNNPNIYAQANKDVLNNPQTGQDLINIAGFINQFDNNTSFKNIGYYDLSVMAEKYARQVGVYNNEKGVILRDDKNIAKEILDEFKSINGTIQTIKDDMVIDPTVSFKENLINYQNRFTENNPELKKLIDRAIDIIPNTDITLKGRGYIKADEIKRLLRDPERVLITWGIGATSDEELKKKIEEGDLAKIRDYVFKKQDTSHSDIYRMLRTGEVVSHVETNRINGENMARVIALKNTQADRELVEINGVLNKIFENPSESEARIADFVKQSMLYPEKIINSNIIRDKNALNSDNIKNFVTDPATFIKYNPQLASVYARAIIGEGREFNMLFENFTVADPKDGWHSSTYSMKNMSKSEYQIFLENIKEDMVKNLGVSYDIANKVTKYASENISEEDHKLTEMEEKIVQSQDDLSGYNPKKMIGYDILIKETLKEMGKSGASIENNPNLKNLLDDALKTGLIDDNFYLDNLNTGSVSNETKDYILNKSDFALTKKQKDVDFENFKYITEAYHKKGRGELSVALEGLDHKVIKIDSIVDIRRLETNGNNIKILGYKDNKDIDESREQVNKIAKEVGKQEQDSAIYKAIDKLENDKEKAPAKENLLPTMENNPEASIFDMFAGAFNDTGMPTQSGGVGNKAPENNKLQGNPKKNNSMTGLSK